MYYFPYLFVYLEAWLETAGLPETRLRQKVLPQIKFLTGIQPLRQHLQPLMVFRHPS